jgi:hypothetical protein
MGARADAIPNAAGGEGGHGAAKPDPVVHRYRVNKNGGLPEHSFLALKETPGVS